MSLDQILTGIINGKESSFTEQELRLQLKKRKLSKDWCWDLFKGCYFYFHKPLHSSNPDSQTLANMTLNRLRLAAEMLGASTSCDITLNTTHVIVYVPLESTIPLRKLLKSLKQFKKVLLESPHINIVGQSWLEECLSKKERLCIKSHLLREGVHASNESESVKQQCSNTISSGKCGSSDSTVIILDDTESRRNKTTYSTHSVREEQFWPAVEENSGSDDRRKRECKGFLKSPNCSLWGVSLEVENPTTFEDVCTNEDKNEEGLSCIQEPTDFSLLRENSNVCNISARQAEVSKLQSDSKLSMSKIIWKSQCLQDIAQLYLGSSSSAAEYLLNKVPEPQPAQRIGTRELPPPACIPKRRFTTRGSLKIYNVTFPVKPAVCATDCVSLCHADMV